jgi:hypothetical protein
MKKRFLEGENRFTRASMLSVTSFISPSSSKMPAGSTLRTLSVKGQGSGFRKLRKLITAASATVAPIIIPLRPRITVRLMQDGPMIFDCQPTRDPGLACSPLVGRAI